MQIDENKRSRSTLRTYFAKNAIPTEAQFAQLIESAVNQRDDGVVKAPGDALSIEASGDAASLQRAVNFYRSFADADPAWSIALKPRAAPGNPATGRAGWSILDSAGNARLAIDQANGNVGVGVVEPKDRLDVAGRVRAGTLSMGPWPANTAYAFVGANTLDQAQPGNYALLQGVTADPGVTFLNSPQRIHLRLGNSDKLVVAPSGVEISGPLTAGALSVGGAIRAAGSDIYFTETDHNHTGAGNAPGNAAIENAKDFEALMLLGRTVPGKGRRIRAWDFLEVNGTLAVEGNLTVRGKRAIEGNDTWLRLNQQREFVSGVHTNCLFAPVSLNVGGAVRWDFDPGLGNITYAGRLTKLDVGQEFAATIRCADFFIGGCGLADRRPQPGRALVDARDTLIINFGGDWANTRIDGTTRISNLVGSSSAALKDDIRAMPSDEAAAIIEGLEPVSFRWKGEASPTRLGFIAEDSPEAVTTPEKDGIFVAHVVAALTRVVRDQSALIAGLQSRLDALAPR